MTIRSRFTICLCVLLCVSTGGAFADVCSGGCDGGGTSGSGSPYSNIVINVSNGGPGQGGRDGQPGTVEGSGVFEGQGCFFNIHRSGPAGRSARVDYRTKDGTATSAGEPGDYERETGSVRFEPHQRDATIDISTNFDSQPEPEEYFFVILSDPRRAVIGDRKGKCTIFANSGD